MKFEVQLPLDLIQSKIFENYLEVVREMRVTSI